MEMKSGEYPINTHAAVNFKVFQEYLPEHSSSFSCCYMLCKKLCYAILFFYSYIFPNLSYTVLILQFHFFFTMLSKGSNLSFTRLHTPSSLRSSMFGCSVPKLLMSEQSPYNLLGSVPNLGNLAALIRFSPFYLLLISSGETSGSPCCRHVTGEPVPVVHTHDYEDTRVAVVEEQWLLCTVQPNRYSSAAYSLFSIDCRPRESLRVKLNKTQYLITVRVGPSLDPHST